MSQKRSAGLSLKDVVKKGKTNSSVAVRQNRGPQNPFLSKPIQPEEALKVFIVQARTSARANVPKETPFPITKPFAEIEARFGIIKSPSGTTPMRVLSSGPKRINHSGRSFVASAFDCTPIDNGTANQLGRNTTFEGGITRSHFTHWTGAGLSEVSSISSAFGITARGGSESAVLKKDLAEVEMVETVYGGYPDHNRICIPGDHSIASSSRNGNKKGVMENKTKLAMMDIALPSAPYDLRITLSTERKLATDVVEVPHGWKTRRLKRRRSYVRKDNSFAWQLDVTEVTTNDPDNKQSNMVFEIEAELSASATLKLINETDPIKISSMASGFAKQLWWMMGQINPNSDVLDVEDYLRVHPNRQATNLALAQCGALKSFMDSQKRVETSRTSWSSAILEGGKSPKPNPKLMNIKFPGCMPVNFCRHNIEEVQRGDDKEGGYFLSEKTDGVRYLMVFTGDTVVLVDRTMTGKQPTPLNNSDDDPMKSVLPLIKPGTVFDGEVVMHRKLRRPIFIVFDVLCISSTEPILHLPFHMRLKHLMRASFRTESAKKDMFASSEAALRDPSTVLPLVRKNFVKRTGLDGLLSKVVEEKGVRSYRNGDLHYHLTDGIIFQPDSPYACGTDKKLLKWKYLDTVTIDVEIMPPNRHNHHTSADDDENTLDVGVLGEEGSMVNMTRFIHLPQSERRRLEADRFETKAKIAEVGLDPTTGEWYYLTMRPDKIAPNHISTVLGSLLELAESLSTEELRYRMSVPKGTRDTYRKDIRKMQKQLLVHQRDTLARINRNNGAGSGNR